MKKKWIRLIAAALVCTLLAGCGVDFRGNARRFLSGAPETVKFADMQYTHPDMDAIQASLNSVCDLAAEGDDLDAVVDGILAFYDVYDEFYTNYSLADIHYSMDLTDSYWAEEYNHCVELESSVSVMLEDLYYALAASPLREELEGDDYFGADYFDDYEGESPWDEEILGLMEQESELKAQYYELAGIGTAYEFGTQEYYDACGADMAQLMVDLIGVRHKIADWWGYDSYAQFATDYYYYRDYDTEQSMELLEDIQQELVPLYVKLSESGFWYRNSGSTTEREIFAYVQDVAHEMGGKVEEAFELMQEGELYDITYGENKYNSSFEVYLSSYGEPFVFMNPELSIYDHLTFAHEFGHFCNDYASNGSSVGMDVAEFFSQGMEYLSLCYEQKPYDLTPLKMGDSLGLYVEQAAFASFEMQMYDLTGDDLSVEGLCALYDQVAKDFGFESVGYDPMEFVTITHFYTNPLYIMSYIVSNDAAMQLYQMELESPGAGLKCYEENLDTQESYFLAFVDAAGLESPFEPGRIQSVADTFGDILG